MNGENKIKALLHSLEQNRAELKAMNALVVMVGILLFLLYLGFSKNTQNCHTKKDYFFLVLKAIVFSIAVLGIISLYTYAVIYSCVL